MKNNLLTKKKHIKQISPRNGNEVDDFRFVDLSSAVTINSLAQATFP